MIELSDTHRVQLLAGGDEYFPALIEALRGARSEILAEVYIFEDGRSAIEVTTALCQAAKRGCRVRLLIDAIGSFTLSSLTLAELGRAGVEVREFRPIHSTLMRRTAIMRLHRKIVAIDGSIAFVGGINISDDQRTRGRMLGRLDYAVRVEGPVVQDIRASCERMWRRARRESADPMPRRRPDPAAPVSFLTRDNLRYRRSIERAYLRAINQARDEILIANAYFFPGRGITRALRRAAARGVRVTLLLQGHIEYYLVYHATSFIYERFLKAGVQIWEYKAALLHAKVAVIDGKWSTVGSCNLDPMSLLLNYEANLVINDTRFADALKTSLESVICDRCTPVTLDMLSQRGWLRRFIDWTCYNLTRAFRNFVVFRSAE